MTTTSAAIYEHGILRPLSPLPLAEGARVELTVTDDSAFARPVDVELAINAIREVAALPMESSRDGFSGREHDRILYGEAGGAQ